MSTITQTISTIPTPPSSSDPSSFDTKADAFLSALPTLGTELNTLKEQINTVAGEVSSNTTSTVASASTATTKANEASASATSASGSATTASTKASEASASATSALASKNAAATSETNALSYKNSAGTAATTATAKAGEASTSATNAATSETAALASKNSAETAATTATTKAGEASTSATNAALAKTSSESARDIAVSAKDLAVSSKDAAVSSASTATTKADAANASAIAAAASAVEAADVALGNIPYATTDIAGKVTLATQTETIAGTDATKAVTPAGLAAAAKGLVSANTTIHVTTTGSDVGGTGAVGTPFASIAKALSSIASKLIASGVTVTIQVADGTYTVGSTIVIDHPDADKIQILGNTSSETTVAITAIDVTAKTITVAGDYTASIVVGDIIGLTGSSTSGLNGAYVVSARSYAGGNTVITCTAETIASATVGGGSIVIMPCNRVVLNISSDVTCFKLEKTRNIGLINGVKLVGNGGVSYGLLANRTSGAIVGDSIIFYNLYYGIFVQEHSRVAVLGGVFKKNSYAVYCMSLGLVDVYNNPRSIISSSILCGVSANTQSLAYIISAQTILHGNADDYSPDANTVGNYNSIIRTV